MSADHDLEIANARIRLLESELQVKQLAAKSLEFSNTRLAIRLQEADRSREYYKKIAYQPKDCLHLAESDIAALHEIYSFLITSGSVPVVDNSPVWPNAIAHVIAMTVAAGQATELPIANKIKIWAAISRYVKTCGGDPDPQTGNNSGRQLAIADIEAELRKVIHVHSTESK